MSLNIELPKFNHPEVSVFYEYDLSIAKEKVIPILELPRGTLIEDMETMLMDTIERNNFFQNYPDEDKWWTFHQHALWMLVELDAKESLPTITQLLEQDSNFRWYWFGDFATENFWEIFYHLGSNSLEELKAITLAPGIWVNRIISSSAAEQIAIHQPERRNEIIDWYRSILDAFLEMEDNDEALDGEVVSSIVGDLITIHAEELLPQIKALADEGLVYNGIVGDMASVEKDIKNPDYNFGNRKLHSSIFEQYQEAMTWHSYRVKYDKDYQEKYTYKPPSKSSINNFTTTFDRTSPIKRAGKKIGRNDPCSCGSGKKYKKCCLKKKS